MRRLSPGSGCESVRGDSGGEDRGMCELRHPIPSLLHSATQLGEGDHRNLEFFGQRLQRPTDLGDLLLAVLHTPSTTQQLQVVDDNQAKAMFRLESARLGSDVKC